MAQVNIITCCMHPSLGLPVVLQSPDTDVAALYCAEHISVTWSAGRYRFKGE